MSFKRFLIWNSGGPPVQWSGTIYAILKEGMMRNIHVNNKFRPVVQEKMSFKYISYLELWRTLCSAERNHLSNFCREYQKEQFCEIILNLGSGSEEGSFKDISYLELWWPFYSTKWNHLCNFGRGHYGEQFCEFIANFWSVVQEMSFKRFLILSSGGPMFSGAEPFMQF